MLPVGAIVVDFDGTACLADVSVVLLRAFGDETVGGHPWEWYGEMVDRHEMGLREAALHQAAMLSATVEEMSELAVAECPMDPTFASFVAWVEELGVPLTLVSDGFGFYIAPILHAAGLDHVPVITNTWSVDGSERLRFEHGHGQCIGCGTCKMRAVLEARAHGPVCFIGEGASDRYGALYADVVFAKDELVDIARSDGVPFVPWATFDDVRGALEQMMDLPGPVAPERCPGWRTE